MVDMTKVRNAEDPKVQVEDVPEEPKEPLFNISLTRDELETIKQALAKSRDFEAFVSVAKGAKENQILIDLETL